MNTLLKNSKKILCVIVIAMLIIMALGVDSHAVKLSEMQASINKFKTAGNSGVSGVDWSKVTKEIADIGSILTFVGSGVLVAVVAYMGIKYMTSGPEAQAKLKTQLIGVVVSGIVILGAYNIALFVVKIAEKF